MSVEKVAKEKGVHFTGLKKCSQGQIETYYMVTSGGEDLPRDIEFLYSKNRLNVAISRAKIVSVIIASPDLLEIPCRTIEQMKLANTLCWVREYAGDC